MLSQVVAVTGVNLRSLRQRAGSSAVAVIGIIGVVIVFVGVLSIAEGFRSAMKTVGDEDTVMVMRSGADSEMTSGITGEGARIIQDKPGIARDAAGPLASPELLVIVDHPLQRSGTDANVPLRGVTPRAFQVHTNVKIVEGRAFEPGRNEIVAGRAASRQFTDLTVGSAVKWGENQWQVVGIFEAGGSAAESELWCDAKVLQPAYRRGNTYQSMILRLASHDSFDQLKDALTTDPQLSVTAIREPEYYERQSQTLQTIIRTIGIRHRRPDGHRRGLRRGEHDVQRRRQPEPRDRHAARARLRQRSRRRVRVVRGGGARASSAASSAGSSRGSRSTATRRRR